MRQLGVRLPEPPPAETIKEISPSVEPPPKPQLLPLLQPHEAQLSDPYPVEVHRIEHQPVDSSPLDTVPPLPPFQSAAEPVSLPSTMEAAPALDTISPAPPTDGMDEESSLQSPPPTMEPADITSIVEAASPSPPSPGPELATKPPAVTRSAGLHEEQPTLLRITEAEGMSEAEKPTVAGGRWAEFGESRHPEPERASRLGLAPIQLSPMPVVSRAFLSADHEPERRSSFLTIVVPLLAVILAIGALLWSGWLRNRLRQQGTEMSALQEQNRKLADTVARMNSDQKALNPEAATPSVPVETAQNSSAGVPLESAQPAQPNNSTAAPAPKQSAQTPPVRHEGVSNPPPVQASQERRAGRTAVNPNYHPEIVPPYPMLSTPQNASAIPAMPAKAAPQQPAHRESPALHSSGAQMASNTPPSAGTSQAVSRNPPSQSPASPYTATSNGMYASALAQNIEAVESLQRQSTVPLREFHARDGVQARVTPGLYLTVRSPEQAHGTYTLAVNSSTGSYQLRGHVNSALAFADNATHRGYELVILNITGAEAYGYIRPVQ